MQVLSTLQLKPEAEAKTIAKSNQEITLGLCMQCELKLNCVWLSNNKQFCEHYE